jgi:hypothetical protein
MDSDTADRELLALIEQYRSRCLWFFRPDYYPSTLDEKLRALNLIERYGDVEAFRRASQLKQWLSPPFNAASAGS